MPNVYQIPGGGAWQDGASGLELQLPGLGVVQESAGGATGVDVSVPSASIAVSATAPSIAAGAALLVGSLAIAVAATAPSIATGAAVSVPSTEVTVSASAPTVAATAPVLPTLSAATLIFVGGTTWKPQVTATYGWSPAALFASSEEGGWYEPGPTTCYTDDGTTAAGEDDLVYRMDDLSGNGHHLYQTTEAYRPALRKSGDLWYLEFDGSDDFMAESSAASTIAAGLVVHWVFTSPAEGAANATALQLAGFGLSGGSTNYAIATFKYGGTGANDAFYPQFNGASASPSAVSFYADDVPTGMRYPVGSAILAGFEIASSTTTSWVNGEDDTPSANGWAENSVAAKLCIANRNGTAAAVAVNFSGGVAVESLTSDERAELFTYLAAKGGVTL